MYPACKPNKSVWRQAGGTVTLLPRRGRVLQVRVAGENAFWENPNWSGDWNVGGDRLWLGPEINWFWKTQRKVDFTRYEIPTVVDPGNWCERSACGRTASVQQKVRLRHQLRPAHARARITRCFTLAEPPDGGPALAYTTENLLEIEGGTPGLALDLWSLIQLPPGGQMIIPCRVRPQFRDYFTPIPRSLWRIEGCLLRVTITGRHQFKIGLPAALITGTVAYARPVGRDRLVVARRFFPQPWRRYCDVPLSDRQSAGDAVQVYNDNGAAGGFGELEIHSPAVIVGGGIRWLADQTLTVVQRMSSRRWAARLEQLRG